MSSADSMAHLKTQSYYAGVRNLTLCFLKSQRILLNFKQRLIKLGCRVSAYGSRYNRVSFTGYVNTAAIEEGSYGAGAGATAAVKTLLATIYHRQGFMNQGIRDIGVAVGADLAQTTIINLGFGVKSQSNSSDYVGVYPADKQTLVPLFASPEAPNPYTEISDVLNDTHRRTTYPVSIAIKEGLSLAIESFTITEAGHTQAIKARIFTSANDKAISSSNAFVVGYEPFKSNTTYMVSFKGTANGTGISKNWTFTTAASCLNVFTCN